MVETTITVRAAQFNYSMASGNSIFIELNGGHYTTYIDHGIIGCPKFMLIGWAA